MSNKPEQLIKEIVNTQYFAVLNTVGDRLPYSNLVSFAITEDLKFLVFVTSRNTRKYKNIKQNPSVSLLIDNRTNSPADISKANAITAIGSASEEMDKKASLQTLFLTRHPQLKPFYKDSENAFILVRISEYIIAGFEKTQRLVI